jgi:dienelactone hydrolase
MKKTLQIALTIFLTVAVLPVVRAEDKKADERVEHAKAFIATMVKEDFKAAAKDFDDTMVQASPPEKMEKVWKDVTASTGAFKKQGAAVKEKAGKYEAVVVTCEFEKASLDIRVVYDADGKIAGYFIKPAKTAYDFKPPPYAKKDSFLETEVTVTTGEWSLPGTLSLPKGDGPFPAVVLVHGSGPHDRDETIGPNKMFRDLAWGLASEGVAVLRYEKRTKAHPTEVVKIKDLTVKEEVLDDALSAVELLRKTKGIDPKNIYVVGHSLGAMAAPRLAQLDPDIAGLVVMASPTRPIEEVLVEQLEYVFSLEKNLSDEQKAKLETIKKDAARLADPKLSPEDLMSGTLLGATFTYWKSMGGLQPTATAVKLKQPIFVLQGERDYQSTMADFEGWKKALADRKNVRLKSYPKLNHLFMEGEGKAKPSDYEKPGHVAKEVIDDVAEWIKK